MPAELKIVGPADASELARLKADTFVESFANENDPRHVRAHVARKFTTQAVKRTLENPNSTTWWLIDDGLPIGFLKVNEGDAQTAAGLSNGLEIEQIYLRSTHHGRGHGGRLIHQAMSTAKRLRYPFVWLGVWERNSKAIAVYDHLGFVPIGDHVFRFGDEEQRDVLMRLDL